MNDACVSSFGRTRDSARRYPGGTACPIIFATVPRSMPKRRAASRSRLSGGEDQKGDFRGIFGSLSRLSGGEVAPALQGKHR